MVTIAALIFLAVWLNLCKNCTRIRYNDPDQSTSGPEYYVGFMKLDDCKQRCLEKNNTNFCPSAYECENVCPCQTCWPNYYCNICTAISFSINRCPDVGRCECWHSYGGRTDLAPKSECPGVWCFDVYTLNRTAQGKIVH